MILPENFICGNWHIKCTKFTYHLHQEKVICANFYTIICAKFVDVLVSPSTDALSTRWERTGIVMWSVFTTTARRTSRAATAAPLTRTTL